MTQNKKRIESTAGAPASRGAAKAPAAKAPAVKAAAAKATAAKAAPPAPAAKAEPVAAPIYVARGATFEATLRHVIRLAEAVLLEQNGNAGADVSAPPAAARAPASSAMSAQQLLTQALEGLEPDAALKLRTLMVAGRDGRGVTAVHVDTKPAAADTGSASGNLSENGPVLADYLRRGHAMACATGFDLERNITAWPSSAPHTLDERAWLSFGVQLAKSQPDDWTCLGFVGADARQLTKLYLRLGEHAWWSFRSLLDRPSAALVDKEKKALTSRRSKGVASASLKTMADRSCGTEGRALRRAVKAIRARVGVAGEPA